MTFGRPRSLLALLFEDDRLTAFRINGEAAAVVAPCAVDPLLDDPQLVGQELRDRLQSLGRLPRRVVVGLPLDRLLVTTVTVPAAVPDDAVAGYLRLEAEREFLLPPEDLALGVSLSTAADGVRRALLVALSARQHANLLRALRLVGLRAMAVVPTATALADAHLSQARLLVGSRSCDLVVTAGGGLLLLRRIARAAPDAHPPGPDLATLPGDVRISMLQLPEIVRHELSTLEVVGSADVADAVVQALQAGGTVGPRQCVAAADPEPARRCCERLARRALANAAALLVLAPVPCPTPRLGLLRLPRRQLATAAAILVAVVMTLAVLVLQQHLHLATARAQWATLGPRVEAVRTLRDYAKTHQAWFSDQPENLDIMRAVTLAFPEPGGVWATRIELREGHQAVITGKATSRDAWLQTLAVLRQTAGIRDLRVSQARAASDGKSPLTFTLGFTWQPPPAGARSAEGSP